VECGSAKSKSLLECWHSGGSGGTLPTTAGRVAGTSGADVNLNNTERRNLMNWSATGAILLALAVILGAFGAHGLRGRLDAYLMSVYEKAVFYHFVHALGVLIVSILPKTELFRNPPPNGFADSCWPAF